jgi:hypothetical protein
VSRSQNENKALELSAASAKRANEDRESAAAGTSAAGAPVEPVSYFLPRTPTCATA